MYRPIEEALGLCEWPEHVHMFVRSIQDLKNLPVGSIQKVKDFINFHEKFWKFRTEANPTRFAGITRADLLDYSRWCNDDSLNLLARFFLDRVYTEGDGTDRMSILMVMLRELLHFDQSSCQLEPIMKNKLIIDPKIIIELADDAWIRMYVLITLKHICLDTPLMQQALKKLMSDAKHNSWWHNPIPQSPASDIRQEEMFALLDFLDHCVRVSVGRECGPRDLPHFKSPRALQEAVNARNFVMGEGDVKKTNGITYIICKTLQSMAESCLKNLHKGVLRFEATVEVLTRTDRSSTIAIVKNHFISFAAAAPAEPVAAAPAAAPTVVAAPVVAAAPAAPAAAPALRKALRNKLIEGGAEEYFTRYAERKNPGADPVAWWGLPWEANEALSQCVDRILDKFSARKLTLADIAAIDAGSVRELFATLN